MVPSSWNHGSVTLELQFRHIETQFRHLGTVVPSSWNHGSVFLEPWFRLLGTMVPSPWNRSSVILELWFRHPGTPCQQYLLKNRALEPRVYHRKAANSASTGPLQNRSSKTPQPRFYPYRTNTNVRQFEIESVFDALYYHFMFSLCTCIWSLDTPRSSHWRRRMEGLLEQNNLTVLAAPTTDVISRPEDQLTHQH
ncbi:hypothetical protein BV898_00521 [Hypsibius exemplaris]|uniref:Uncharacterized protein n=1 Tax=Hypsibius exemplaris TaxID=2072580 RepID=A0A1W0XDM5_HYPEX|nr:hypothetical protein BV898_00521 [Hypsibius exemplaris]